MFYIALETKEDISKIETLYNKYSKLMFAVAYNILNNPQQAEDALQQAFIKVMDNLGNINISEEAKTKNFLVIIIRNIAINMYNKEKGIVSSQLDESIPDNLNVEKIVISNESLNHLISLICSLKPIYQDVILLRYSRGFTVAEISQLLDINTKTVQKRIERGKALLLNLLIKEEKNNG